ncbi:biotin/lipoyl-binding protein [bacterium]|nr:biotin/lipoyl-binding protein [bacterium]
MSAAAIKLSEHRPPPTVPAEEFMPLAARLHQSLELNDVATAIAEAGRLWTRWDRISVYERNGRSWRLRAVTGQTVLAAKSPTNLRLTQLIQRTQRTPRVWSFDQRQSPPLTDAVSTALAEYLAVAAPCRMQLEPVLAESWSRRSSRNSHDHARAGKPIAVLVFEDFEHRGDDPARDERTLRLVEQATLALNQAWQVRHIPLRGWWLALGIAWRWWTTSRLLLACGTLLLLAAALYGLTAIPADLQIHATGQLVTAERRRVFAPVEGEVVELLVATGDTVTAGQPLLRLSDLVLQQDIALNRSRIAEVQQSLEGTKAELHELTRQGSDALEHARLQTQLTQQQIKLQGLYQQSQLLKTESERQLVTAPISGTVTTPHLRDQLTQRPLQRGDLLLEIASDRDGWQLELMIPEAEFGKFQRTTNHIDPTSATAEFRLTSQPQEVHHALVTTVAPRTIEVPDVGPCIPVTAQVADFETTEARWGADVEARLIGPQTTLAEALFGDFIDALYRWSWW